MSISQWFLMGKYPSPRIPPQDWSIRNHCCVHVFGRNNKTNTINYIGTRRHNLCLVQTLVLNNFHSLVLKWFKGWKLTDRRRTRSNGCGLNAIFSMKLFLPVKRKHAIGSKYFFVWAYTLCGQCAILSTIQSEDIFFL
jgi:hypothetical protein